MKHENHVMYKVNIVSHPLFISLSIFVLFYFLFFLYFLFAMCYVFALVFCVFLPLTKQTDIFFPPLSLPPYVSLWIAYASTNSFKNQTQTLPQMFSLTH